MWKRIARWCDPEMAVRADRYHEMASTIEQAQRWFSPDFPEVVRVLEWVVEDGRAIDRFRDEMRRRREAA